MQKLFLHLEQRVLTRSTFSNTTDFFKFSKIF